MPSSYNVLARHVPLSLFGLGDPPSLCVSKFSLDGLLPPLDMWCPA